MGESGESLSGILLFCASSTLYLWSQNNRQKDTSDVGDNDSDDGMLIDVSRRHSSGSAPNLCNPLNSVRPIGPHGRISFMESDSEHLNSAPTDGTIWNHFDSFGALDHGHRIHNSLCNTNLDDGVKGMPTVWDSAMTSLRTLSPSSSFGSVSTESPHTNHRSMPNKLILVRHGQSEGNVNEMIYATKPDNSLNLTKLGWDQAIMAGKALKESIIGKDESTHFIVSPYVRTMETFHGMLSAWCDPAQFKHIHNKDERLVAWYTALNELGITWSEDPRIREQDFGNYQDPAAIKQAKSERYRFGAFYYRFPYGESASDVFDRVSTFLDSLWRSFHARRSTNYVIVTHGISIRVFLARYFRYTIDQFNMLANPKNGEVIVLGHDGAGKLKLSGRSELVREKRINKESGTEELVLTGYTFHTKLRCNPIINVRRREVKLSFDD